MKRLVIVALGSMILFGLGARFVAAQERTFTGVIADENLNCIENPMKLPSGMEKALWNKESCVLYYAHSASTPSKYVLYDPDMKAKYQLDDQKIAEPWVGDSQKVKVTGTLDEATKTIHIKSIKG